MKKKIEITEAEIENIINNAKSTFRLNLIGGLILIGTMFETEIGAGENGNSGALLFMMCGGSDVAGTGICVGLLGIIYLLTSTILILIGFIKYIIFTVDSYKILSKLNISNLSVHNVQWVRWGWLCPVINLYKPYQILRDIYENINKIIGKKYNNILILIRRIAFLISFIIPPLGIIGLLLYLYIINDLSKSYKIYLENLTEENK